MSSQRTRELPACLFPSPCSGAESTDDSTSSKGLYFIPAGHSWDKCWELASDLYLEVNLSQGQEVAVSCLELQEYGVGVSLESAVADLLTSLSDYYESLVSREDNLAEPAVEDLQTLRNLLRYLSGNTRGC